jgi:putative aminopeptidase FrvX
MRATTRWACLALMAGLGFPTDMLPQDRTQRLLAELSNASGPSGSEGSVRGILVREMRSAGLEISTDGLGSVIGVMRGQAEGPRIMLAAHIDELAAMVRYVTPEGMVKFQVLGYGWIKRWSTNVGPS